MLCNDSVYILRLRFMSFGQKHASQPPGPDLGAERRPKKTFFHESFREAPTWGTPEIAFFGAPPAPGPDLGRTPLKSPKTARTRTWPGDADANRVSHSKLTSRRSSPAYFQNCTRYAKMRITKTLCEDAHKSGETHSVPPPASQRTGAKMQQG